MSTSRRRSYHHGDLRAELVRVAGRILDQSGAATLTLREAARRAGVSHSAPYRHFADREALLAEVAAQGHEQLGAALREARAAGGAEVARAYLRFALAQPRRYRLMYAGEISPARRAGLAQRSDPVLRALADSIPGLGDAQQGRRAATAAWALLHGLAELLLGGYLGPLAPDGDDSERLVREVVGAIRFAAKPAVAA
ncbi:MAG TPA: TetR/AcrR family transcriptional regulator [Burkholderiales bacterium]|nr:TetR/AcrR family transcriptional regulator [Burkholderiales bacterium]